MDLPSTHSIRTSEDQSCSFRRISRNGLRVVMEVTSRCNLQCRHCFACSEQAELHTFQWLSIVEYLPTVNAQKVIITGGEPLLRKDLERIIYKITSLGIGVDLNTNMTAFTPNRAKKLKQVGLSEISASLDGMREYHDWFRRKPGNFDRVIKGIQLALSLGFEVDVHGVCTPGNIHETGQVIDLCIHLGVSSYTVLSVVSLGLGIAALESEDFSLKEPHKKILRDVLAEKRTKYEEKLAIRTVDIFDHPTRQNCPMGETVIGITPTGKLKPCLLAQYLPSREEDLSRYLLPDALGYVRQRTQSESKLLMCSNEAFKSAS